MASKVLPSGARLSVLFRQSSATCAIRGNTINLGMLENIHNPLILGKYVILIS